LKYLLGLDTRQIAEAHAKGLMHPCEARVMRLGQLDVENQSLKAELQALKEENEKLVVEVKKGMLMAIRYDATTDKYNELIMAVGNKCKDETRHETALRYIKQAELGDGVDMYNNRSKSYLKGE